MAKDPSRLFPDARPRARRSVPLVLGAAAVLAVVCGVWVWKSQEEIPRDGSAKLEQRSQPPSDIDEPDVSTMPNTPRATERASMLKQGVQASHAAWPTEAFSENATTRLKQLAKLIPTLASTDSELPSIVAREFHCTVPRPSDLESQSTSPLVEIRRMRVPATKRVESDLKLSLSQLFQDVVSDARAAFKIVRVQPTEQGYATVVHAEGGGITEQGRMQWTAAWDCDWTKDALLKTISVTEYEEVISSKSQQPWLVDATAAV